MMDGWYRTSASITTTSSSRCSRAACSDRIAPSVKRGLTMVSTGSGAGWRASSARTMSAR